MLSATQKDWALSLPAFTIITILAVIPALMLFFSAFTSPDIDGFTLLNFEKLWDSKLAMQAFWRTVRVSISVTLITIILGYPLAIGFLRAGSRLQPILLTLLVFPLMVSVVVRAYGWIVVLSPSGILNQFLMWAGIVAQPVEVLHTELAVILGESQLLLPYMVLSLVASLQKADTHLEEASMSLGANPVTTFFRIVIPVSVPGLLTGTLLVFALALTAFATPLLLGGGRTPLLTTLIYTFAFTTFDWAAAAAVGLILIVLALGFVVLQRWVGKKVMHSYE